MTSHAAELTIERRITFGAARTRPTTASTDRPASASVGGRVPRVARLLALAHRVDQLVRSGEVADYATVARLGGVTRARVAQVVALLNLCPSVQEAILEMSPVAPGTGDDPISEHDLRPIAADIDWKRQRRMWRELRQRADS